MDVEKHLSAAFGMQTRVTRHALERISERLTLQRLYDLGYLIKAGLREYPLDRLPEHFAFVDTRYNIGLVAHRRADTVNVMTVIHGKPLERYRDTFAIGVRIDRERHLEEVNMLRAYQKRAN
jgi:hypothetical protein